MDDDTAMGSGVRLPGEREFRQRFLAVSADRGDYGKSDPDYDPRF
jgi:hypothetical protein